MEHLRALSHPSDILMVIILLKTSASVFSSTDKFVLDYIKVTPEEFRHSSSQTPQKKKVKEVISTLTLTIFKLYSCFLYNIPAISY